MKRKKIDFLFVVKLRILSIVFVLCFSVCFQGCAQVAGVVAANPELVVNVNDLITNIAKIAGNQLIEIAARAATSDSGFHAPPPYTVKLYRYKNQLFLTKNDRVTQVWND